MVNSWTFVLKTKTYNFHVIIREFVINFIFNTDYFFRTLIARMTRIILQCFIYE